MLLDQFNLNQIRVFECVYRTRSMTMAAKELHITQSGVSQHIKSLEEILEITLFDRVKQKLLPTSSADLLYIEWSKSIADIEKTLLKVSKGNLKVQGKIKFGCP
jgi:DNA-binding transcriptional LysR family regulator